MTGPYLSAHVHQGLTEESFAQALQHLSASDPDLGQVIQDFGPPPLWSRDPGFPTLVHIILEQQVSLASARAAFDRLLAAASPLTPGRFLALDDIALKRIGFSRQKTAYCRHLADSIVRGSLNLESLARMDDAHAQAALLGIKGIGQWTADIYLLMALLRPDVWPVGDLALAIAVQRLRGLPERPSPSELDDAGQAWQPWRAVAARILWHYYLNWQAPR